MLIRNTRPIDGTKAELGKFNTKFVFRGHQDASYACKNLVRGIRDPICLIPLEKKNQNIIEAADAGSDWIAKNASSLDQLRDTGFLLGELPDFIGPVFTFTNASAARVNYDEGFGLLSVGTSWEKSRLKFYISRPEILSVRAALYSPADMAALIPREIPVLKATDLAPALLLPHYTHIDGSGNATIYIRKPATLSYTTHIFEKCLARYGAPSGFSEGVSADFIPNISRKAKNHLSDSSSSGDLSDDSGMGRRTRSTILLPKKLAQPAARTRSASSIQPRQSISRLPVRP